MTHLGEPDAQNNNDTPVSTMRLTHTLSSNIPDRGCSSSDLDDQDQQQLRQQLQYQEDFLMCNEMAEENMLIASVMDWEDEYETYQHDEFLMSYTGPDEQLRMERDALIHSRWASSCLEKHPDELYDDYYYRNYDPFELDGDFADDPEPPEDYTDEFLSDWYQESGLPPEGLAAATTTATEQPSSG